MEIFEHPSPNHGARRQGARPALVVLHHTGMATADAALARLCDPAAEVSAHYLIAEDGRVWQLVAEERRAWHAGVASWGAGGDVNSRSIGLELANPGEGPGAHPYPEPQMRALEALLAAVCARWTIPPEGIVGHACVAPTRKADPGRGFDWRRLALSGLAIWDWASDAQADPPSPPDPSAPMFQQAARRFGYPVPQTGRWDGDTLAVWRAFCLRFRPQAVGDRPSGAGLAALVRLAQRYPAVGCVQD
ncbi:MAG: N-acetylmuramoyl-L-alanine amidase [Pikeienuella sp.]